MAQVRGSNELSVYCASIGAGVATAKGKNIHACISRMHHGCMHNKLHKLLDNCPGDSAQAGRSSAGWITCLSGFTNRVVQHSFVPLGIQVTLVMIDSLQGFMQTWGCQHATSALQNQHVQHSLHFCSSR